MGLTEHDYWKTSPMMRAAFADDEMIDDLNDLSSHIARELDLLDEGVALGEPDDSALRASLERRYALTQELIERAADRERATFGWLEKFAANL